MAPNTPKTLKAPIGQRGIPNPKEGTEPHLFVTVTALPRALRILGAFLFDMEGQGHFLKWPDKEKERLTITADGEGTGGSVLPPHSNFDRNCLANLTLGRTYLFSFSRYP